MITSFETRACDHQIFSLAREAAAKNGLTEQEVVLLLECDADDRITAYVVPHAGAVAQWPIIGTLGRSPFDPASITVVHLVCAGGEDHAIKGARRAEIAR